MRIVIWILAGVFLLAGSIWDIKDLALPVWFLRLGGLGCLCSGGFLVLSGNRQWWEVLVAFVPGAISLFMSYITKEQIGYGDGWILVILGGALEVRQVLAVWMGGLAASFLVSVMLLISRRAGRDFKLPFVPCLLVGYLAVCVGGV